MKLYIITNEPFPNGMAATKRIACYAKSLVMQGDKCEIILFHRTEVYGKKPNNTLGNGQCEGYTFRYIGGTPLRGSNVFYRRYCDYIDKVNTLRYLSRHLTQEDVVMLYMREETSLTQRILRLAKKRGVAVIRELCEYPFGTQEEQPQTAAKREAYMRDVFTQFDGAVCISEPLLAYAKEHHPNGRFIKVPILVEQQVAADKYEHERPYIFHGGTMFERKDAIVSTMKAYGMAFQRINGQLDFILAGPPSPHQKELDRIIREYGMEGHVTFLPLLPPHEVAKYQNGAYLTILSKNDNPQNRFGFSTKLGEIMMSETPVITTTVGEANCWLKDGESAYIVEPHRPELIADKIVDVFRHPEESRKIALRAKEIAVEFFSLPYQGKRLHDYFCSFVHQTSS